jgi:hypothetical protein
MGKGGKKKRGRRVIKTAKGAFSNFDDKVYRKLEASKKDAFQTYIRSNRINKSTDGLSLHRPDDGGLPIIYIDVYTMRNKAGYMLQLHSLSLEYEDSLQPSTHCFLKTTLQQCLHNIFQEE